MEIIGNWWPWILAMGFWLLLTIMGYRQTKNAREFAASITNDAINENEKNIAELKEIKELLKEIKYILQARN